MLFLFPGLKLYSETLSKHRQQKNSGAKHFFFFFLHQHAWEDILWVLASLKLVAGRSCHLLFPDLLCYLLFLLLCLVPKLCPTPCDPMDCSMSGSSVLHYLLEFARIHVHWVGVAIQPFHPLPPPSPFAFNLFQHQGLSQWAGSLHQVAKVMELTIHSDFGAQENKICHFFHFSPSICHEVMGPDAMTFIFFNVEFLSQFFHSSFTIIKRLFSSSALSAIWVVSFVYLRLLILLLAILIPACDSSSLAFHMMHSAYKLKKQGDNIVLYVSIAFHGEG